MTVTLTALPTVPGSTRTMLSDAQFSRIAGQAPVKPATDDRRRCTRLPFNASAMLFRVLGKGSADAGVAVRCRNISLSGVAFLHHATVPVGQSVLMRFPAVGAQRSMATVGSVKRSDRVADGLYIVAVSFDGVPNDAAVAAAREAADASALAPAASLLPLGIAKELVATAAPDQDDEVRRIQDALLT